MDKKKQYLSNVYLKGYRYVATDIDGSTYFYSDKPIRCNSRGQWDLVFGDEDVSAYNFGTTWNDKEPTLIEDLLNKNTDWTKVPYLTPVIVFSPWDDKEIKAYFVSYDPDSIMKFTVTLSKEHKDESTWMYCELASD